MNRSGVGIGLVGGAVVGGKNPDDVVLVDQHELGAGKNFIGRAENLGVGEGDEFLRAVEVVHEAVAGGAERFAADALGDGLDDADEPFLADVAGNEFFGGIDAPDHRCSHGGIG